jgi:DNA-binding protein YbaB
MFNKLKQFKDLRDQAKKMQSALSTEVVKADKNGVTITLNGNMEIIKVEIENDLNKDSLAEAIKSAGNEAIKKAQRIMAEKVKTMGGFPGLN